VVDIRLRMQMFRNYVEPCFTYACGTWGVRQVDRNWFEAQHRKLLKRAIGAQYPKKIRNKALHQVTDVPPMRLTVTRKRWRLFGECLRLPRKAPAQIAMDLYLKPPGKASRGHPTITLPYSLHQELKQVCPDILVGASQKFTSTTLQKLRQLANVKLSNPGLRGKASYPAWEKLSLDAERQAEESLRAMDIVY